MTKTSWSYKHGFIEQTWKPRNCCWVTQMKFERDKICDACQMGKQTKSSFKSKSHASSTRPLELLHMDLFRPTRTSNLGEKRYALIVVHDLFRFTWVSFLAIKDEILKIFSRLCRRIQNESVL